MTAHKKLIYSQAATERRAQLVRDVVRRIDAETSQRKYVPGVDVVEVTASDLDEIARSIQIKFHDRYDQRQRTRTMILNLYVLVGAFTLSAGIFYDEAVAILREPTQVALVAMGLIMMVAAYVLRLTLERRSRLSQREHEFLRVLEDHEGDGSTRL